MDGMVRSGFMSRLFGHRKPARPRPATGGVSSSETPVALPQQGGNPHEDLERAARGFVEEHEFLLDKGDDEVLQRVYVQGANIFTTINPEAIAAANRAAAAKRALAAAIRDPKVPALRMQEIKEEEAEVSLLNASLNAAGGELSAFLEQVRARLPEEAR